MLSSHVSGYTASEGVQIVPHAGAEKFYPVYKWKTNAIAWKSVTIVTNGMRRVDLTLTLEKKLVLTNILSHVP